MVVYQGLPVLYQCILTPCDAVYEGLSDKQKRIAEVMFRTLTKRVDIQRDTHRPLPLAKIVALPGAAFEDERITGLD